MEPRTVRRPSRVLAAALALWLVGVGCTDDGEGRPDQLSEERDGPNPGALPTVPGGVPLAPVDPATALVGTDVAYGTPLPSEQLAAEALTQDPEIGAVVARRALGAGDGRHLADVVAATLVGGELFDEAALRAFEGALVAAYGGGPAAAVPIAGRDVLRAVGADAAAIGWRDGDLLVVVAGPSEPDVTLVVTRQLEARARGEVGTLQPTTPLPALPIDAAFVPLPAVAFAPIPPPEVEPASPVAPSLPGATGVQGRYGVVAGERRTVVWAFTLDPATYPSAEALDPQLGPLVSSRAGGAPAVASEVVDRVVLAAGGEPGTPSARVFRHQGLVLLVEGDRPDQLDAVVTAWVTALAGG